MKIHGKQIKESYMQWINMIINYGYGFEPTKNSKADSKWSFRIFVKITHIGKCDW